MDFERTVDLIAGTSVMDPMARATALLAAAEMEKAKAMYQIAQSIEIAAKTLLWQHSDS